MADTRQLTDLALLLARQRDALLARWRARVRELPSAQGLSTPALNDHMPALIDEMVQALQAGCQQDVAEPLVDGSPPVHGIQRFQDGFDIVEVVAEYDILRGCIHDLCEEHGLLLHGAAFHILNRLFHEAIGLAVQTFVTQQTFTLQRRREEYLAFVAHDLRTPLNAIGLAAQALEALTTAPAQVRLVNTLRRNVRQLQQLVEAILKETDHVRTDGGLRVTRRSFELWPLVQAVVQELQPMADAASARLTNEVPDELTAHADASLIKRVFHNLVANAVKHTPRGEVVIGARLYANGLECWVRDTGTGIPPERLDTIFDKLQTDAEPEDGNGLGLAIVKSFVEAHGGQVSAESAMGTGSTFRFTLPAEPASS